jgi:hypothetical protein
MGGACIPGISLTPAGTIGPTGRFSVRSRPKTRPFRKRRIKGLKIRCHSFMNNPGWTGTEKHAVSGGEYGSNH